MSDKERPSLNPFTLWLRAMGSLADVATLQGRTFKQMEDRMSGLMGKLATSPAFLDQVGKSMERNFQMRAQMNHQFEQNLHSMRMPTLGDLPDIQVNLRQLDDNIEALGARMDSIMDAVERLEKIQASGGKVIAMTPRTAGAELPPRRPRKATSTPRNS